MNRFVSFLETIGHDFKVGLSKLDPILKEGVVLATDALPILAIINPLLTPIARAAIAAVSTVEQKFAAMGKQTGTGAQKMADSIVILEPIVAQALAAEGKAHDIPAVEGYINAVVKFLNSLSADGVPVSTAPIAAAAPAPAPAAPAPAPRPAQTDVEHSIRAEIPEAPIVASAIAAGLSALPQE